VAARATSDAPVGGTCSTDSLSENGGEYLLAGQLGQPTLIAGLAPNGVQSVVVTRADGSNLALPVTHNTYLTTVAGQLSRVTVGGSVFELPQ